MAYKDKERKMEYQREYQKKWYWQHKERLLEKRKQHDEELRQWLRQYKNRLGCAECGENHPACLHFHHINREEKSFTIGTVVGRWRYVTLEKLQEEMSKCTILCGNCHAILHWRETHKSDELEEVLSSEQ